MKIKLFLPSMILAVISFKLFAQEATSQKDAPLKLLLGLSAEFGGEDVAKVYFTNGKDQSVRTGQGVSIFAGGQLKLSKAEKFYLRSAIGFKYVTTAADNANIRLTRIPFNSSFNFFPNPKIRLAAGLSTHNAIKLNGDGFLPNLKFKANAGPLLEFAYQGFGISYTIMNYEDEYENKYSANSFGITYSGVLFGKK